MSVTQDYKLPMVIVALHFQSAKLIDLSTEARMRLDWTADAEITRAINFITSAIVALECAS